MNPPKRRLARARAQRSGHLGFRSVSSGGLPERARRSPTLPPRQGLRQEHRVLAFGLRCAPVGPQVNVEDPVSARGSLIHVRLSSIPTIGPIQVSRHHRMVVILRRCKPQQAGSRTSPLGWPRSDPAALSSEPAKPESGECPLRFG